MKGSPQNSKLIAGRLTGSTSRRTVLKRATALGLSASAFSAMPSVIVPRVAAQAEGRVNLLCFAGEVATAIRTLSESFMSEYPNIEINLEEVDFATAEKKMWLDFASKGGAYDIVVMLNFWFARAMKENALQPIDDFLQQDDRPLDLADYPPPVLGTTQQDGKNFGFPLQGGCKLIYYRADKFAEAGIATPSTSEDTWSWTDYQDAVKALHRPEENFFGNAPGGKDATGLTWAWSQHLGTEGTAMFTDDLHPNIDQPASIEYLEFLLDIFAHANPGASAQGDDEGTNVFLQGNSAILEQWGDVGPRVYDSAQTTLQPEQVGYAPIPKGIGENGQLSPFFAMWSTVLSSFAKNPGAAYEFMSWLSLQDKEFANLGGIPTRESTYTDPVMIEKFPHFEVINFSMPFAQSLPVLPEWAEISNTVGQVAQKVILGQLEPAAAATEAQAGLDKLMSQAGYY